MFWVWTSLATFFGIWIGVAIYGKGQQWSGTQRFGGGFLAACLAVSVAFVLIRNEYRKMAPETLEIAGISGKQWDQDQLNLAAQITANTLRRVHASLLDGDKRGDPAAGMQAVDVLTPLMAAWNDQKGPGVDAFRNCRLASAHLANGAIALMQGSRFGSSGQFEAALSACESSIR